VEKRDNDMFDPKALARVGAGKQVFEFHRINTCLSRRCRRHGVYIQRQGQTYRHVRSWQGSRGRVRDPASSLAKVA
jgi:hypothetical protein